MLPPSPFHQRADDDDYSLWSNECCPDGMTTIDNDINGNQENDQKNNNNSHQRAERVESCTLGLFSLDFLLIQE